MTEERQTEICANAGNHSSAICFTLALSAVQLAGPEIPRIAPDQMLED